MILIKKKNNEAAVVGWKESDLYQYKSSFPLQIAYKKPSLELIRSRRIIIVFMNLFTYIFVCMYPMEQNLWAVLLL